MLLSSQATDPTATEAVTTSIPFQEVNRAAKVYITTGKACLNALSTLPQTTDSTATTPMVSRVTKVSITVRIRLTS